MTQYKEKKQDAKRHPVNVNTAFNKKYFLIFINILRMIFKVISR